MFHNRTASHDIARLGMRNAVSLHRDSESAEKSLSQLEKYFSLTGKLNSNQNSSNQTPSPATSPSNLLPENLRKRKKTKGNHPEREPPESEEILSENLLRETKLKGGKMLMSQNMKAFIRYLIVAVCSAVVTFLSNSCTAGLVIGKNQRQHQENNISTRADSSHFVPTITIR